MPDEQVYRKIADIPGLKRVCARAKGAYRWGNAYKCSVPIALNCGLVVYHLQPGDWIIAIGNDQGVAKAVEFERCYDVLSEMRRERRQRKGRLTFRRGAH